MVQEKIITLEYTPKNIPLIRDDEPNNLRIYEGYACEALLSEYNRIKTLKEEHRRAHELLGSGDCSRESFRKAEVIHNALVHYNFKIPVRFPFVTPNNYTGKHISDLGPKDKITFEEVGHKVHVEDLYPTEIKPVSEYGREKYTPGYKFQTLLGSGKYLYIRNKQELAKAVKRIQRQYKFLCQERLELKQDGIFYEARIYGLDALFPFHNGKMDGIILELLGRNTFKSSKVRSSVFIFTNREEEVFFVDGVDVPGRRKMPVKNSFAREFYNGKLERLRTPASVAAELKQKKPAKAAK